jgi:SPASM domain peptide maturase of grasp-with-spasm system
MNPNNHLELDNYFILSSNCIVTIGAVKSTITDFQRAKIFSISKTYGILLEQMNRQRVSDTILTIESQSLMSFYDFLDFLVTEEIGFLTHSHELFPRKRTNWSSPFKVSNAIMDFTDTYYDYKKAFKELDELGCQSIQVRFYNTVSKEMLFSLLEDLNKYQQTFVEIYCPYDINLSLEDYHALIYDYNFLSYFYVFNSPFEKEEELIVEREDYFPLNFGSVYYISEIIKSEKGCGLISLQNMNIGSIDLFHESINHNGCLNRKISISKEGQIKNCPSMPFAYGHIDSTSIKDVLQIEEFTRLFYLNKKDINICRDCEFRSNCTDCRAYLEEPSNIYSKPLKCGYDPYSNIWQEWSANPLKHDVINKYAFGELENLGNN